MSNQSNSKYTMFGCTNCKAIIHRSAFNDDVSYLGAIVDHEKAHIMNREKTRPDDTVSSEDIASNNLPGRLACPICHEVYDESNYGSHDGYSTGLKVHHSMMHPAIENLTWYEPKDVTVSVPDDPINPNHYKLPNGHEAIEVTENLNGNGAQAVNYIIRATRRDGLFKSDPLEDLKKAAWFIDREIQYIRQTAAIAKYVSKE